MKNLLIALGLFYCLLYSQTLFSQPVFNLEWAKELQTPRKFIPKQPFFTSDDKNLIIAGVDATNESNLKFALVKTDLSGNVISMNTFPEVADYTVFQSKDRKFIYGFDSTQEGYMIYINTDNLEIESTLKLTNIVQTSRVNTSYYEDEDKLVQSGTVWFSEMNLTTRQGRKIFDEFYFSSYAKIYKLPVSIKKAFIVNNNRNYILLITYYDEKNNKTYNSLDIIDSTGKLVYRDANYERVSDNVNIVFNRTRDKILYTAANTSNPVKGMVKELRVLDLKTLICNDTIVMKEDVYTTPNLNSSEFTFMCSYKSYMFNWSSPSNTKQYYDIKCNYGIFDLSDKNFYTIEKNMLSKFNLYPTNIESEVLNSKLGLKVNDGILNINFESEKEEKANISITNLQGQTIMLIEEQLLKGLNSFHIPITNLANGSYILTIQSSTTNSIKFIK